MVPGLVLAVKCMGQGVGRPMRGQLELGFGERADTKDTVSDWRGRVTGFLSALGFRPCLTPCPIKQLKTKAIG